MLRPSPDMATMAMDMDMVMDTMDTMARDLLRLSQDMATTVMVMDMVMAMDTAMVDMDMDTMVTMARDLLMLSQDMDTMVMVMDMDMVMDTMDMDMVMVMDTTDKYLSFLLCSLEFSTNEIGPSFGTSHFQTIQKSSINYFLL